MDIGRIGGPANFPPDIPTDQKPDIQKTKAEPEFTPADFDGGLVDGAAMHPAGFLEGVAGTAGAAQASATGAAQQTEPAPQMSLAALRMAIRFGGTTEIPNEDSMPFYNQGSTNGCGTTSLAMIMTYLTGQPITQGDIDKAIRRMDVFTSPGDLLEFARDKGLAAEGYNNGTWEEMKGFIDQGLPCQALISADGSSNPGSMHYIAITGYGTDPATGKEFVTFHDPATGAEGKLGLDEFKQKWSAPPLGFENYFNVYGPPGTDLPSSRFDGIEGTMAAAEGIANLTNNLNRLYSPDSVGSFAHGLIGFPGGILQTVVGGIGAGISLGGQALNDVVEGIPVVENLVQPFGDIVNGVGAAIGDIGNGFGEAFDSWGQGFEDLFSGDVGGFFSGLGEGFVDIGSGIVDGVGDFFSGVGDAVSDFFSGW